MADLHVPIRAGHRHRLPRRRSSTTSSSNGRGVQEYVRHYTNAPVIIKTEFRDTEDVERILLRLGPEEHSAYAIDTLGLRGHRGRAHRRQDEQTGGRLRRPGPRRARHEARSAASRPSSTRLDAGRALRLPDPAPPLRALHAGDGRRGVRLLARGRSSQVAEALCENSGRERTSARLLRGRLDAAHDRRAEHPRRRRSSSCCSATSGGPGGGILALRGHANIQGSTDIPTLYDILPGYIPMPHPQSHPTLDKFVELNGPDTGRVGLAAAVHRSPAEGVVGRRGDATRTSSASTTCRASTATTRTTR